MKAVIAAVAVGVLAIVGWLGFAGAPSSAHLLFDGVVARAMGGGKTGVFLSIENLKTPDRLIAVHSPDMQASLYSPASEQGLVVPVGQSALALDAGHIVLDHAPGALAPGALVPLTLTFEQAGQVSLRARLSEPAQTSEDAHANHAGLFGHGDVCVVGDGEPAPQISLIVTPDGDGWAVEIAVQEFTFSQDLMGLYHVPGMGHGHIYVGGMKLGRLFEPRARIGALPRGTHELRVTLNTNDHRAYVVGDRPVTASAVITVD